jgi:hypothetical protein
MMLNFVKYVLQPEMGALRNAIMPFEAGKCKARFIKKDGWAVMLI